MKSASAFRAAGFSTRTANALVFGANLSHPDELNTAEWGSGLPEDNGLWRRLKVTGNLGKKGMAEVQAFRAGRDPWTAVAPGPVKVTTPFDADLIERIDAWIAAQPNRVSRPEAVRAMVAAKLAEPRPAGFQSEVGEPRSGR